MYLSLPILIICLLLATRIILTEKVMQFFLSIITPYLQACIVLVLSRVALEKRSIVQNSRFICVVYIFYTYSSFESV